MAASFFMSSIIKGNLRSVCRNDGDDVAVFVELHDIYTYLTMGAGNACATIDILWIDAVIYYTPVITIRDFLYYIVFLTLLYLRRQLDDGIVCSTVNLLVWHLRDDHIVVFVDIDRPERRGAGAIANMIVW